MIQVKAFAAYDAESALKPFDFERKELGAKQIQIDILYSGVCHSDIHTARSEWGPAIYPLVPGHEIVGRIVNVGSEVTNFKVGDLAGVGCFVDSCRHCASCKEGEEQYCEEGMTATYNSYERGTTIPTYGGYSTSISVDEKYALHVSEKLPLEGVAPLLCAGITTYSPLRYLNVGKGHKVAVLGLGGLGHMAIKLAHSMGAAVSLITTSPAKADDAKRLGAQEVIISKNPDDMARHAKSFDLILNTAAGQYDLSAYLNLLKRDGTMVLVGVPNLEDAPVLKPFSVILPRRKVTGSAIGGIQETQEMLDYCAQHQLYSDIELIPIQQINEAYDRMQKSDVKYRFVIDMQSLG